MPHSWKLTSDNLILKRKTIYEKYLKHNLQRLNQLGRNDPRISSESCQQIQLLEVIMELTAIQIILFGVIILVYMAEEFNK
jgi:hypothetical protein